MSQLTINLGTAGQVSGDTIRDAMSKVNSNFDEAYAKMISPNYSGDAGGTAYSTTTSEVYTAFFGDTIPPGTYMLFVIGHFKSTVAGDVMVCRVYQTATSLRTFVHGPLATDYTNITNFGVVTMNDTGQLRGGIYRLSGSGTVSIRYLRFWAIKLS